LPSDIAEEHIAFNIKGQEVADETFLKASETTHPTAQGHIPEEHCVQKQCCEHISGGPAV